MIVFEEIIGGHSGNCGDGCTGVSAVPIAQCFMSANTMRTSHDLVEFAFLDAILRRKEIPDMEYLGFI